MLQQIKPNLTVISNYSRLKAANDDYLYSELTNEEQKLLAVVIKSTITTILSNRGG